MIALVLGLALFSGAVPHRAAPSSFPIVQVLQDADDDGVPDAVGRTVTVAGRASTSSGRLNGGTSLFIQDATGGIRIDDSTGMRVSRGDSVVVTGRIAFRNGLAELAGSRVQLVAGPRRPPVARPYDAAAPERVEGRLVSINATVAGLNPVPAGEALLLSLPDGTLLVAFVFSGRTGSLDLSGYAPGDRIRVTGVAGQYDREAPYRNSYQIYPRTPDDVAHIGLPNNAYRKGALVVAGLLGLALLWAATLRRQVARRMSELRRSEDRYRVLVESASEAVIVHDLEGHVAELNDAGRKAVGIGPDATVPPFLSLVPSSDHAAVWQHLKTLVDTGRARSDIPIAGVDGSRSVFEFDSQTIELDGEMRVLSLARDVGMRRAHERALVEAREAAEEALRVKSAFLASMSHEIRTPLTAVLGYAEILADEVADDQRDLVAAIENGGTRLLATLNSVLDLARLDAGRETLRPVALDLTAHIGQSVALLHGLAASKGLRLDFAPETPALPAYLDTGALDRILTNLVGNAIKFTDQGAVTVGLRCEGDAAVVTVADTGIGMSEAFLPNVFSEFRQESEGEARSHEGTGLGLSITRSLATLMGGGIEVASQSGAGTTFTVTLPLVSTEAPEPAEARLGAVLALA